MRSDRHGQEVSGFKPLVAEFERRPPGFRRDRFRIVALPDVPLH